MSHDFESFRAGRAAGNVRVPATDRLATKRSFALDKQVCGDSALPAGAKELLGLVASLVLRCNDCVDHPLERCVEERFDEAALDEAMGIAMMVGGSIVIPHARHAAESLAYLLADPST
jgi:AhpD family alkylhydroperoxidase